MPLFKIKRIGEGGEGGGGGGGFDKKWYEKKMIVCVKNPHIHYAVKFYLKKNLSY